jgi:(heptosyl)LPS beta-1,4-glucosyltransferase
MTNKSPVTCVILTQKTSNQLNRAIQSVQWCSEVLLAWTGTDTETIPHCTNVSVSLKNGFADARNAALQHAKQPWILFLDDDEFASAPLKNTIQKLIQTPDCDVYAVRRRDIFMGKLLHFGECGQISLTRLMKKGSAQWVRPVHETLQTHTNRNIGHISEPIIHTPHHTLSLFLQKINAYTAADAKYRAQQGKQFSLFELFFFPVGKWIQSYILKGGIFDGYAGFIHASMMSIHSLSVRVKMYKGAKYA